MPDEISCILRDDPRTDMQLLPGFRAYAAQRFGEAPSAVDVPAIRGLARTYLKGELDVLNSTHATRLVIRRSHLKDNGSEISEPELQHHLDEIRTGIASDNAAARKLRVMLLRDWMEEHFEQTHVMPIQQFLGDMVAAGR